MTWMIPRLLGLSATRSEADVFELISKAQGSETYYCLSSLGIARHLRKDYGEADFMIIGPPGVFCLEVKGGEIHRRNGTWEIGWPGKSYFSAEGPFKQAQGNRWALSKELGNRLNCDFRRTAIVGWGVVFPDVVFSIADPEWSQEVVYDIRDKANSFIRYIERLETYARGRLQLLGRQQPPKLTTTRIREIVAALRADFDVVQSLGNQIRESDRELLSLSSQQYAVLDYALNHKNPRLLCDGPPGSGKTLVAVEAARRLSSEGRSVLMLCFNRNLANNLRSELRTSPRVSVCGVHEFFESLISTAGMSEQLRAAKLQPNRETLFFTDYPRLFEQACELLINEDNLRQFEVLVVDEGQDFLTAPIFNALGLVIEGGIQHGRWAIFLDSGLQAEVFAKLDRAVLEHFETIAAANLTLGDNFRNPKSIVREVCAVTGAPPQHCRRRFDAPVEYLTYPADRQVQKLSEALTQVLSQGARPDQITVLSMNSKVDSCAFKIAQSGEHRIAFLEDLAATSHETVTASSVSGFKGLENEVVILTDIPRLSMMTKWQLAIMYVAMTRAKSRLFVLVEKDFVVDRFGDSSHTTQES